MRKTNTRATLVLVICALFQATDVLAQYCAVGNIKGNVCSGFVIEACKFVQVDAVKGDDDILYTVGRCYESVSEYSESKGRC